MSYPLLSIKPIQPHQSKMHPAPVKQPSISRFFYQQLLNALHCRPPRPGLWNLPKNHRHDRLPRRVHLHLFYLRGRDMEELCLCSSVSWRKVAGCCWIASCRYVESCLNVMSYGKGANYWPCCRYVERFQRIGGFVRG